jgi:hypothetical protein
MLEPNTIYAENFRFLKEPEEMLFRQHVPDGTQFSIRFNSNFVETFIDPSIDTIFNHNLVENFPETLSCT